MTRGGEGAAAPDEAAVRAWCRAYLARVSKTPVERIGDGEAFTELGMDSAELLFMVSALEEQFGLELASDTTTEFSSVDALAPYLVGELARR